MDAKDVINPFSFVQNVLLLVYQFVLCLTIGGGHLFRVPKDARKGSVYYATISTYYTTCCDIAQRRAQNRTDAQGIETQRIALLESTGKMRYTATRANKHWRYT
ncbi:MAG: hypothetical protein R2912_02810 [Eubacteriales bacterium]